MDLIKSGSSSLDQAERPVPVQNTEGGTTSVVESEIPLLLPRLPDDIALSCLARVPHEYHAVLSCVSKRWRRLVCGKEFHAYRLKNGLDEPWIYALCIDKTVKLHMYVLDPKCSKRRWREIHGIPYQCSARKGVGFEVLDNKIYLLGGCGWVEDATDEVYCYDASANTWSRAASLPTPRCYFAYEALDGKIYAIRGLGSKSTNTHSLDVFDSSTNSWSSYFDSNVIKDVRDSMVLDRKIYIRCGPSAISLDTHVILYDPSNCTSRNDDSDTTNWWCGDTVVIESIIYILDQNSGVRLMMWDKDTRECIGVTTNIVIPPCHLVAIGKRIFVIGKGFSTMMFDVEDANSLNGIMVNSSSLRFMSEDLVIR